jgi:hypothetical protein
LRNSVIRDSDSVDFAAIRWLGQDFAAALAQGFAAAGLSAGLQEID